VLARIEKSKICGTIFSRVCTESNFGLFTFVCLRHRSSAYRDLHTSLLECIASLSLTDTMVLYKRGFAAMLYCPNFSSWRLSTTGRLGIKCYWSVELN